MARFNTLALWLTAALAIGVAGASARYLLPGVPGGAPNVVENPFAWPWLRIHAGLGLVALAIGPFQFMTDSAGRRRRAHRWAGRGYMICCLLAAPAGFILATGATAGPVASAGFGTLAVLWFAATGLGWSAARGRRFESHRRWMIRSYALTFAAVTLRLYLPVAPMLGFPFMEGYRIIAWACWVPNLIIGELILRGMRGSIRT